MKSFDDIFILARAIQDPAARAAFLDEACAREPQIRERLEALLVDATAADAYFAEAETQNVPPPGDQAFADTAGAVPEHIGPYRILERIGHGGMGDVFRAVQKQPIRREVALKLIRLGMDTQQVIARFEAERQALALMDHPHIARVLDAGADAQGRPYFVMELVRGVPVTQYADEKRLTLRERLVLMQQVCQAVQHAHSKGVIHRDLKPGNILVSTQDGRPHAKVIDFGIAKATSAPLTDKTLYTQFQQFIGTPQYMSPEQAEGSLDIDTRSDVYSLGVLLYELLTGHTPVDAATLRKAALHEVARIIREHEAMKPSTRLIQAGTLGQDRGAEAGAPATGTTRLGTLAQERSIPAAQLIRQVRGELDWLVMKTLEKDRARRYETPNNLSEDIARYLEGQPIQAAPPGTAYRVKKFIRKHRAPVLSAAAVLMLMLAGILGTSWGLVREKAAREEATGLAQLAEQERSRAEREKEEAEKQRLTAEREKATAEDLRAAAELESYISNLAAAQADLAAHDYPGARARLAACPERLRGWEWKFLNEKAKGMLCVFPPHVLPLKFTPDSSSILAYDSLEKNMRLYDLEGKPGEVSYVMFDRVNARTPERSDVGFDKEGKVIVCMDYKGISAFETATGKVLLSIESTDYCLHDRGLRGLQISSDGQKFLVSSQPVIQHLDGRRTVLPIQVLASRDYDLLRLIADTHFDRLLTTHGTTAQLWDADGKAVGAKIVMKERIQHAVFNHDGTRFLISTKSTAIQFDHLARQVGPPVTSKYGQISFSPDGKHIVTGADKKLLIWNANDMSLVTELSHSLEELNMGGQSYCDWSFSEDGSVLLALTPYGKRAVRAWEFPSGKPSAIHMPGHGYIAAGIIGKNIITSGAYNQEDLENARSKWRDFNEYEQNGTSSLRPNPFEPSIPPYTDANTAAMKQMLTGPEGVCLWSSDGHLLAMTDSWTGSELNDAIIPSPDGTVIVVANQSYDLDMAGTMSEVTKGCAVVRLQSFGDPVWRVSDTSKPEPLEFWAPAPGHHWRITDAHGVPFLEQCITAAQEFEDSKTSSFPAKSKQSRVRTESTLSMEEDAAKQFAQKLREARNLHAVCISKDGLRVFGLLNQHVIVWDVVSKRELAKLHVKIAAQELRSFNKHIKRTVAFSDDGTRLRISFPDGAAQIWDTRPFEERQSYFQAVTSELAKAKDLVRNLVDSSIPTSELRPKIAAHGDLPKLSRLLALSFLEKELKIAENTMWAPRIEWGLALRAKPEFIEILTERGIVKTPRTRMLLLEAVEQDSSRRSSTYLLSEIFYVVLSEVNPKLDSLWNPFSSNPSSPFSSLSTGYTIETAEVAFSALDTATRSAAPAVLCESLLKLACEKTGKDLMKDRAVASRVWASLAWLFSQHPRQDELLTTLGKLLADDKEHITLAVKNDGRSDRVFLRRNSEGKCVIESSKPPASSKEQTLVPEVERVVAELVQNLLK